MSEEELDYLEKYIPSVGCAAFEKAYLDTLSRGMSVVEAENGVVYSISPDGTKTVIKEIDPPIKATKGSLIILGS